MSVPTFCLEQYEAKETLGSGRYGVVKKYARNNQDASLPNVVAVKILNLQKIDPDHKDVCNETKGIREVKNMHKLEHKNIVEFLGIWEIFMPERNASTLAIVMESCCGTLEDIVTHRCPLAVPLDPAVIRHLMLPICDAIVHIHASQHVHRDIKPSNILLRTTHAPDNPVDWKNLDLREVVPKIGDFGFARRFEYNLSQTEGIGTQLYRAPEIVTKKYDMKVDVFSLGMIGLVLVAGNKFWYKNRAELGGHIRKVKDRPWRRALEQMLQWEPDKRWTSKEVQSHLRTPVKRRSSSQTRKKEPNSVVNRKNGLVHSLLNIFKHK